MNEPRKYKVFSHVTGLVLFELVFWAFIVALYFLVRSAAPQFELHMPGAWPALLVAPMGLLLFARHYLWKQRRMSKALDVALIETLWPQARPRRSVWKFLLWRTGVAILALGMLAPKLGTRLKEVEAKGVDIMVALDVSRSMMAEDVGMARLDLAKRTIERMVGRLDGDRAGLVVFAGDAYVQAPLTLDLAAVKLFLDAIGPEAIPVQGTAVGSAIELCTSSFDDESQASRIILVLTDGENHEDDALARADEAAAGGIQVHAIGMASEGGGPIPVFDRYGRQTGYKEDASGQPVVSTLDERMLVSMVEAGGGTYARANQGFVDLDPFLDSIADLETGETNKVAYTDYVHHFPWFFLVAWALLLAESLWPLAQRRSTAALGIMLVLILCNGTARAQSYKVGGTKAQAVAGTEAMVDRDFAKADSLFQSAEGWSGADPGQLSLNRGLALAGKGEGEAAMRAFQRAASQAEDPRLKSDAWSNVGDVLLGGQDVEGAIGAYKEALRLDPMDADTRHNLSLALSMRQEQQQQEQQKQGDDQQDEQKEQQQQGDEQQDEQKDQQQQNDQQEDEQQDQQQDQQQQNDQQGEGDQQQNDQQQDQQQDQGQGQQDSPDQGEQQEGRIHPADAERILDLLERNEAALRAKLQAQENAKRNKGKKSKIEKDW